MMDWKELVGVGAFVLLAGAGWLMVLVTLHRLYVRFLWRPVPAELLERRTERRIFERGYRRRKIFGWVPLVSYRYWVGARSFESTRLAALGGDRWFFEQADAEALLDTIEARDPAVAYRSPLTAAKSVLLRDLRMRDLVRFVGGLVVAVQMSLLLWNHFLPVGLEAPLFPESVLVEGPSRSDEVKIWIVETGEEADAVEAFYDDLDPAWQPLGHWEWKARGRTRSWWRSVDGDELRELKVQIQTHPEKVLVRLTVQALRPSTRSAE